MNELLKVDDGWVSGFPPPIGSTIWIKTDEGVYASFYGDNGYLIPLRLFARGEAAVKAWKMRCGTGTAYSGEF